MQSSIKRAVGAVSQAGGSRQTCLSMPFWCIHLLQLRFFTFMLQTAVKGAVEEDMHLNELVDSVACSAYILHLSCMTSDPI